MDMLVAQRKNAAKIAQYEFYDGRFERAALDRNHRLELRVVDDGFLTRHHKTQKRLLRLQQTFAWWYELRDWARAKAERNSRELREYLLKRLTEGKVYIKTFNMQTGHYCFRLVSQDEIPPLAAFLQEKHLYHLYFSQGDDPTVMSLIHLGTFPT